MLRPLFLSLLLLAAFPAAEAANSVPAAEAANSVPAAKTATSNPAAEAATSNPAAEAPAKQWKTVPVVIDTELGKITVALETERAPVTAANFLKYVDGKRYDGTTFYRAMNFPGRPELGLVQGGIKSDPGRALPAIAHEPTTTTGLSHDHAAISMARAAPGSANGDFFIILGGLPGLDADPKAEGDTQGFAVFGHVTDGMDVVQQILAAPVSATEGVGVMKGQMIARPVTIRSVRRAN